MKKSLLYFLFIIGSIGTVTSQTVVTFYTTLGDFEVEIEIDGSYVLAGSGILQNADKVGRGYSDKEVKDPGKRQCWKFKAENVHFIDLLIGYSLQLQHFTIFKIPSKEFKS